MNYTPTFLASGYGFTNFHAVQWEVRHVLGTCWLTSVSHCRPGQRTGDDLEIIYDELLHIKALAHLSNTVSQLIHFSFKGTVHIYTVSKTTFICPKPLATKQIYLFLPAQFFSPPQNIYFFMHSGLQVKRELASVVIFESHAKAGTVCESSFVHFVLECIWMHSAHQAVFF